MLAVNKRAAVGLFTLLALGTLLGVFVILSDTLGKAHGYKFGVRFPSAAALNTGALVYESGVIVGTVDSISLLPDYSSEVVLGLHANVDIPSNAHFLIVQPLQGDPTLRIILHPVMGNQDFVAAAPFPHEVLPLEQQPMGKATLSLAEFLAEGQNQFARIDSLLAQFQQRAPQLLAGLQATLSNATRLTNDADASLVDLRSASRTLTAQLTQSLALASANMIDITEQLDEATKQGQPHIQHMLTEADLASTQLAASLDSLHTIAADPALHTNIIEATHSLAATTETLAALLQDLRKVTGDAQTQSQLRDVVAHVDAASQKADALLGSFGGKSNKGPVSISSLASLQVRVSELSPEQHDAHGRPLRTALLGKDQGPQTDLALVVLPQAPTSVVLGVNDLGYNPTLTLAALKHAGPASYGGGILYSRLGVTAGLDGKHLGVSTNVYDPRHGTVDVYGKIFADETHRAALYVGERDATHDTRRDVLGIQLSF